MPRRKIYVRETHFDEFLKEESILRHETAPQLAPEKLRMRRVRWDQKSTHFSVTQFTDMHFYHITNHLESEQQLYEDDVDVWRFRQAIKRFSRKYNIQVIALAIMRTHFHLLITAFEGNMISCFMQALQSCIVQRYNRRHKAKGKRIRFAGRFRAIWILNSKYLHETTRYIHLNPYQQGIESSPGCSQHTDLAEFLYRLADFGMPVPGGCKLRDILMDYTLKLVEKAVNNRPQLVAQTS